MRIDDALAAAPQYIKATSPGAHLETQCNRLGGPVLMWEGLGLKADGTTQSCAEVSVTLAQDSEDARRALGLTDLCQQEIVVRDSETGRAVFRQPSHDRLAPGSCVTFVELRSGAKGYQLLEDESFAERKRTFGEQQRGRLGGGKCVERRLICFRRGWEEARDKVAMRGRGCALGLHCYSEGHNMPWSAHGVLAQEIHYCPAILTSLPPCSSKPPHCPGELCTPGGTHCLQQTGVCGATYRGPINSLRTAIANLPATTSTHCGSPNYLQPHACGAPTSATNPGLSSPKSVTCILQPITN